MTKRVYDDGNDLPFEEEILSGVARIAIKRQRQANRHGHGHDHDSRHKSGELALASACLAEWAGDYLREGAVPHGRYMAEPHPLWPWGRPDWVRATKDGPIEALVNAGALAAAEIDRCAVSEALDGQVLVGDDATMLTDSASSP